MVTTVGEETVKLTPEPTGAPRSARWALRAIQIGTLAVVLVVMTNREFELDRFFVPKEVVLHVTALVAGLLAAAAFRRVAFTWVDLALVGYLVLSVASAAQAADRELAMRALALSVSSTAVFWAARAVRDAGSARQLLRFVAVAAVVGAVTCMVQAYGVESDFFSINRAPGGTLGNRNFIAHMAAFGLPVVLMGALRAWRPAGYAVGAVGVAIAITSLVLTRSRAGWLAFGAVIFVFAVAMLLSRPLRGHGRTWRRLAGIVLLMGGGVAAAILVPNSLEWRSDNPYLDTVTGIANYQEGSGRGRLVQYGQSLRMAIDHAVLGVGPGNWPVVYPDYAAPDDPSMARSDPSVTANPWPSSDWVAFVAERGLPAAALLGLAFLGLVVSAFRRLWGARDEDEALVAATLLATIAATLFAGLFDAVLLLAAPALLVWAALGAMWSPPPERALPIPGAVNAILLIVLAVAAGAGAALSILQLASM